MGRQPKWVDQPYIETRVRAAEAEKRARLKAELAELAKPLFGVELDKAEKRAIRARVHSGKIAQALFPGGRSRGTE